ncbi:MAG: hypothetical protein ACD_26C00095G0001 [uncultured bacterium]|nr:MAG: hypothetical protein ACD_26C00095G0001 [uncultured bacterium]
MVKKYKMIISQQVLNQLISGMLLIMLVTIFIVKYSVAWMYIPLFLLIMYAVLEDNNRRKTSIIISTIYCFSIFAIISIFLFFKNDTSTLNRIILVASMAGGTNIISFSCRMAESVKKNK